METKTSFHEFKERVRQSYSSPGDQGGYSAWMQSVKVTLGILRDRPWNLSIYKVPNKLRELNEDAYSPRIVSIGPFHQRKHDLLAMEEHKWRYMLALLHRTPEPEKTLDECGEAILNLEKRARGCYAEYINFNEHEVVEILLVDCCFILELFLRYSDSNFKDNSDPILNNAWMVPTIQHDLALLENQIPFFVLESLFDIIKEYIPKSLPYSLTNYVLLFFCSVLNLKKEAVGVLDGRHLLDILHKFYLIPICPKDPKGKETWGFKHCATKLSEAGIQFEKGTAGHLLDIKFSNGVIKVPPLCINETMDSLFRNLIAFEQCSLGSTHHITSYAILIKGLIHSSQDIEFLQRKGIIANNVGGGEDVSTFFNSICKEVVLKDFYFAGLCEEVNAYHESWWHWNRHKASLKVRWHRYIAALKHDYFSNPWRIISFIAAIVLLLLTGVQTFYSVRSYYPH